MYSELPKNDTVAPALELLAAIGIRRQTDAFGIFLQPPFGI